MFWNGLLTQYSSNTRIELHSRASWKWCWKSSVTYPFVKISKLNRLSCAQARIVFSQHMTSGEAPPDGHIYFGRWNDANSMWSSGLKLLIPLSRTSTWNLWSMTRRLSIMAYFVHSLTKKKTSQVIEPKGLPLDRILLWFYQPSP